MTPLARFFEFADARRAQGEEFPVPEGWFKDQHLGRGPVIWYREVWCNQDGEPEIETPEDATALDYRAACDCVSEWMILKYGTSFEMWKDNEGWNVRFEYPGELFINPCKLTALLDAAGEVER